MSTLTRKIAHRKGLRTKAIELQKEIETYLKDKSAWRHFDILGLENNLKEIIKDLNVVDEEIHNVMNPIDVENDIIESRMFLRGFYSLFEKITEHTNAVKPWSTVAYGTSEIQNILPNLELPVFRGNPLEWQEFWNKFNTSIHLNDSITDIDRFSYLKRYLSPSVLATIYGLTANNYKEAIKLLRNRYGNPQLQITAHMEALIKMKVVTSMDNIEQMKRLYSNVKTCIKNLKHLKVETSTYSCLLIPILNDRIPDELRALILSKFGNSIWNLEGTLNIINEEIQAKEHCASSNQSNNLPRHADEEQSIAEHLLSNSNKSESKCVYCLKKHPTWKCKMFPNIESRVSILRTYAKCFVCLQSGHISRECQSNYICGSCLEKHHISICKKEINYQEIRDRNTVHFNHPNDAPDTPLQTEDSIVNKFNRLSIRAKLMFDIRSQQPYTNDDVRRRLVLPSLRRENILINTFGNAQGK